LETKGTRSWPIQDAEVYEHKTPADRDLSSDRPGRVQEMATTARNAIEPADYHQEEAAFLTRISARVAELVAAHDLVHLPVYEIEKRLAAQPAA
jgi:Bacterial archaeo-eukaryotic release factor family 12